MDKGLSLGKYQDVSYHSVVGGSTLTYSDYSTVPGVDRSQHTSHELVEVLRSRP